MDALRAAALKVIKSCENVTPSGSGTSTLTGTFNMQGQVTSFSGTGSAHYFMVDANAIKELADALGEPPRYNWCPGFRKPPIIVRAPAGRSHGSGKCVDCGWIGSLRWAGQNGQGKGRNMIQHHLPLE